MGTPVYMDLVPTTVELVARASFSATNDFNNTAACQPDDLSPWAYCPSEALALAGAAAFGIAVLGHTFMAFYTRRAFCIVVILGTLFEFLGYALRAYSTQHQRSVIFFAGWTLILLVTPLIINAWVYMILGRLIDFFVPERTVGGVYSKRVALIFVLTDIATFLVQLAGGGIISVQSTKTPPDQNMVKLGSDVFLVGMVMQQISLAAFGFLVFLLHRRLRSLGDPRPGHPWFPTVVVMYIVVILISIRSTEKIVEYADGASSSIAKTEWTWYVFDTIPIAGASLLLLIMHPGRLLKGPGSEYVKISKSERKELVRRYKEGKMAQKHGLEPDSAELGLLPSGASSPQPPMPPQYGPMPGYGNNGYGNNAYNSAYNTGYGARPGYEPMRGS